MFHSTIGAATLLLLVSQSCLAATTSGGFSLLSLNVAGLPGMCSYELLQKTLIVAQELLSSGDPAVNTPLLSVRLPPYNVINVQEDFNYHAALYADDTHPYRTPTSGN